MLSEHCSDKLVVDGSYESHDKLVVDGSYESIMHSDDDCIIGSYESYESIMNSDDDCIICLFPIENMIKAPCGHKFCKKCLLETLSEMEKCPLCRKSIRYLKKDDIIIEKDDVVIAIDNTDNPQLSRCQKICNYKIFGMCRINNLCSAILAIVFFVILVLATVITIDRTLLQ
jgi:hypothetical protein